MIEASIPTFVLIAAIAVISPLLAERLRRFNVPDVVLELAFGIIVGPYVLKLAHTNDVVNGLSDIGLAFLMFLAGYELDLQRIRGRPLQFPADPPARVASGVVVAVADAGLGRGVADRRVARGPLARIRWTRSPDLDQHR